MGCHNGEIPGRKVMGNFCVNGEVMGTLMAKREVTGFLKRQWGLHGVFV